jgi:UDP-N-acetylmuramate dehydrogenase
MEWKGIRGQIMEKVPMKRYTSMKVGGPARLMAFPADEADLAAILRKCRDEGLNTRVVGNGTNVIVSDQGIDEALIRLTKMRKKTYKKTSDGISVEVAGGISLTALIRENARRGLSGLERLYWIPGTVGGALRMNAGSFGASVSDPLQEIRVMDREGKKEVRPKMAEEYGYRKSPVTPSDCVVNARFLLTEKPREEVLAEMEYVFNERMKRHPMEFPSSGSMFKSVHGEPAWKFIEQAGLKGYTLGGARVSEKHANFIINLGSARASDIFALTKKVKSEVFEKTGVLLEEEVEFWGFDA